MLVRLHYPCRQVSGIFEVDQFIGGMGPNQSQG